MSFDNTKSNVEDRIDREAAEWFIKRDHGLTPKEARDYAAWLNMDPRHPARLEWHEQTWRRFSVIEEFDEVETIEDVSDNFEKVESPRWFQRRFRIVASLAAVLLLGVLVWSGVRLTNSGEKIEFESRFVVGAYENRILADGSILELNQGARLKVRFTDSSRNVWLHAGEAHFHVAKDERRPFIVHAGDTRVRAVGTAFNVKRDPERVQVVVTEGRVHLSRSASASVKRPEAPLFSREMDVGQVSTVKMDSDAEAPVIETYTYDELSELLAWKPQTLEFNAAPLGDVVMAFNKRNDIQIVLADDELETMPIAATFRSDNVLAFTRLLEATFELRAERPSQNEIVLSRPH